MGSEAGDVGAIGKEAFGEDFNALAGAVMNAAVGLANAGGRATIANGGPNEARGASRGSGYVDDPSSPNRGGNEAVSGIVDAAGGGDGYAGLDPGYVWEMERREQARQRAEQAAQAETDRRQREQQAMEAERQRQEHQRRESTRPGETITPTPSPAISVGGEDLDAERRRQAQEDAWRRENELNQQREDAWRTRPTDPGPTMTQERLGGPTGIVPGPVYSFDTPAPAPRAPVTYANLAPPTPASPAPRTVTSAASPASPTVASAMTQVAKPAKAPQAARPAGLYNSSGGGSAVRIVR